MDIAEDRENFWGQEAGAKFYKKNLKIAPYRTPFIANMVKVNNAGSVLELGCNVGRNLAEINKVCPDVKITGFDISEEAMQYAKEVENNPAEFIVGSIYDLSDFEDNSYDMVFTSSVLFHIPTERVLPIIKEMKRIASKFIFNIERYTKSERIVVWRDGTPHQWGTDYVKAYVEAGLDPTLRGMHKLLPKEKVGGASHLIYASLCDEPFRIK
jgi:ubiquinone/menaquinone biosynthesis C-methylase UbiE